jgi:hypothetical protein
MHQPGQGCSRGSAAITARGIAAGLTPRGRGYAGKPDDAIPKAERFAIKNADLCGFRRDGPICGSRAEQVGRQAKTKDKRRDNRASHAQPRTAEAGAELPSLEYAPWFSHQARDNRVLRRVTTAKTAKNPRHTHAKGEEMHLIR